MNTTYVTEGVNDPGILKAVFLAGGPGSGKSFVADDLFGIDSRFRASFSTYGLKVVNLDTALTFLLHKHQIDPKDLARIAAHDPEVQHQVNVIRARAAKITAQQVTYWIEGRLGLIFDGTAGNIGHTRKKRQDLIARGYDTMMLFVNTTFQTALERNANRSRRLPDETVKVSWEAAQRNMETYRALFGEWFIPVMNEPGVVLSEEVRKRISAFLRMPIQNPIGREWLEIASTVEKLSRS